MAPVIAKLMVSRPAWVLAAMMASRRDTLLSVPPFKAFNCSAVKLVPRPLSLLSVIVVTVSVETTSVTVTARACVSVKVPSET
ncbi:hypothetical protein AQB9606_04654 [Aquabacterium sp. CECT 9606]|nr:hypothetical protein AQB9606_04654 [Aquabacterium sp. CECT 9606]